MFYVPWTVSNSLFSEGWRPGYVAPTWPGSATPHLCPATHGARGAPGALPLQDSEGGRTSKVRVLRKARAQLKGASRPGRQRGWDSGERMKASERQGPPLLTPAKLS